MVGAATAGNMTIERWEGLVADAILMDIELCCDSKSIGPDHQR